MDGSRRYALPGRLAAQDTCQRSSISSTRALQTSFQGHEQHHSAPHSPPYRAYDSQKPSLPPLETLLGDRFSSSPPTTTILGAPFQPAPREPAYIAATYKPPSLYPHKKQKTGPVPDSAPVCANVSNSPGSINGLVEPQTYKARINERRVAMSSISYADPLSSRRCSAPQQTDNEEDPQFRPNALFAPSAMSGHGGLAHHNRTQPNGSQHYRTPDQTPTSTALNQEFPAVGASRYQEYDRGCRRPEYSTRRGSIGQHPNGPDQSVEARRHGSTYPPMIRQCPPHIEQYGSCFEDDRSTRHPRLPSHAKDLFERSPYETTPPSYLMPSQYEYQHGKARQRGNLPKQSTEIMKTWFDQNITNPYPSEEQKALFSRSAIGSSTTDADAPSYATDVKDDDGFGSDFTQGAGSTHNTGGQATPADFDHMSDYGPQGEPSAV
ncbi:homeodomain super [Friedmanniomyces endolithicus]|nr:homeodomain super [Friedmanniomyces endolithicus]